MRRNRYLEASCQKCDITILFDDFCFLSNKCISTIGWRSQLIFEVFC